jgi:proline iminopeptidase
VLEHGYLLPHLNKLAETHRLILFDQRLSGRSSADVPAEDVTFEKFLGDIDAVREYAGESSVHVMGHSWGGLLAMMYASSYPEQTRSLILVSPMPGSWDDWQEENARLASLTPEQDAVDRNRVMDSEAFAQQEISAFEELYRISFRSQFHDRSKVDGLTFYIAPDLNERSRRFGALMPQLQGYNLYESLSTITAPTLLMYGAAEPAGSMSGLKIRNAIDGAIFSIIPDAGHFSFVESPDEFNDVLSRFLGMRMTP